MLEANRLPAGIAENCVVWGKILPSWWPKDFCLFLTILFHILYWNLFPSWTKPREKRERRNILCRTFSSDIFSYKLVHPPMCIWFGLSLFPGLNIKPALLHWPQNLIWLLQSDIWIPGSSSPLPDYNRASSPEWPPPNSISNYTN